MPTVHSVRRNRGVAGQFSLTAEVEYPGEPMREVTFVGSVYGGPVIMIANGHETFVENKSRFGNNFGPEWVRAFFAAS